MNCDGHSRTAGSVQEPGVRPGAREESASPALPATSAKNAHIHILFSYRVIYVITLSYYVKIFGSIPNSRQSPLWLLEKIIWNCVLSRAVRLYRVITHNVPGKAICVPILWFNSLHLNNHYLSKHACKVVLYLFCIFPENTHEEQLIPAKILYQCPSRNILDFVYDRSQF